MGAPMPGQRGPEADLCPAIVPFHLGLSPPVMANLQGQTSALRLCFVDLDLGFSAIVPILPDFHLLEQNQAERAVSLQYVHKTWVSELMPNPVCTSSIPISSEAASISGGSLAAEQKRRFF